MSQKYRAVIEFTLDEEDEAANAEYSVELLNELKEVVKWEGLNKATLEEIE